MPLSEYEQRVLAQMEQQLSSDDPKLAETFTGAGSGRPQRPASRVLLGVIVAAVGLTLIIVGLAQSMSWLGVVGFLVMFGGVLLSMSSSGTPSAPQADATGNGPRGRGPSPFMSRLDERWERRRDGR